MTPVSEAALQPAAEPVDADPSGPDAAPATILTPELTRRGFLRGAAITGGGLVAATLAACAPATPSPAWTFGPVATSSAGPAPTPAATPGASASVVPSATPSSSLPPGWSDHDIAARRVVRRFVGNLAPALEGIYGAAAFAKLVDILGAQEAYPELEAKPAFVQVPQLVLNDALEPLTPEIDGEWKVFRLTVDEIEQSIDELMPPVAALGYNGQTPGPTIRVTEGDKVRAIFTNNLEETTGVHFHGVEFDDFFMDGVPFVTQKPFGKGESFTYEFTASRPGSLMYHSHHNATDQVGRGLLGAFIVEPRDPAQGYAQQYGVTQEVVFIHNDALGGFTINGHGFPATVPIIAQQGDKVLIRFMNEGGL
ncbi:MAG TPA: multicopper oxidase domain-containing protein, partial [Candidatus Limnocylindrales bacterium]|nr:multicopper oxidase domain-containing protein [Candidatus Limnocylindrales bacterium]